MPRNAVAYENDYFAWTQEQAALIRSGEFSSIDSENVAEELESMGRSLRRELHNRLAVLLMHLLKWQHQPAFRSRSWSGTAREQRRQIVKLIEESPSLGPLLAEELADAYGLAVIKAVTETGLSDTAFPAECPFSVEQILAEDFLPGS